VLDSAQPPGDDVGATVADHRILVVEDNADVRQALEVVLRAAGYKVLGAETGAQALAQARTFGPRVALIDLGLPDMSGHEVARRLRADPSSSDVILVAVTGWAQDEDRERSEAAGFDRHLVKPVEPGALYQLLASLPPGGTSWAANREAD
jgi:CheY-like chemotaxis protein